MHDHAHTRDDAGTREIREQGADGSTPPEGRPGATKQDKTGIIVVCLAVLAVAGYMWFESTGYRTGAVGDPGPSALPRMVAAACALVSVLLIVQTLRTPTVPRAHAQNGRAALVRVVIVMVVVALSAVALPLVGYTVTMVALMLVVGYLAGARRWWSNLLLAVVMTWVSLLLFSRVFMVPLPLGPLDRILGG